MARTSKGPAPTPVAEWIVAAIGGAILVAVFGFLLWRAIALPMSAPDIRVEITSIASSGDGHRVEFVARNRAGQSAEGVLIQGELRTGTAPAETAETTIDYVPGRSEARGGLFFRDDPRRGTLTVRALGYEEP